MSNHRRVTPQELFAGHPLALQVLDRAQALLPGHVEVRTTASQVALRRRRGFAWVWLPGQYLAHPAAEVVLSLALGREDTSPRWKQVAHPSPRHWVHHLEVRDVADLDEEVGGWLREAYERAG